MHHSCLHVDIEQVQWMQDNSELELCHSKRGREDVRARGSKMAKSLSEHV
jgi:hypothetical protein